MVVLIPRRSQCEFILQYVQITAAVSGSCSLGFAGEVHEIKGKKIKGIGLGNIFNEGPIKLRKAGPRTQTEDSAPQPMAAKRVSAVESKTSPETKVSIY